MSSQDADGPSGSATANEKDFRLFGFEILNVPPAMAMAYFMTIVLVSILTVLLFVRPDFLNIVLPILIRCVS
jgi:hypothetical protein